MLSPKFLLRSKKNYIWVLFNSVVAVFQKIPQRHIFWIGMQQIWIYSVLISQLSHIMI